MDPSAPPNAAPDSTSLLLRGVRRSVALLAAGEAVNKAARFAAAVVLARSLSLDQFGLLNVGLAIGGIVVVLVRLGLPDLGTREVAASPARAAEYAGRIVTPQVLALLTLVAGAVAVVAVVDPAWTAFAAIAGLSMLGLAASADWLLRGQERMRQLGTASGLTGIATLASTSAAVAISGDARVALIAFALAELIGAGLTWRLAHLPRPPRPQLRGARTLLRQSWPMAVSGVVIYAYYANIDTLIIAATRSAEEAGIYSGGYRLFLALNAIVIFAGQAILPVATRLSVAGAQGERASLLSGAAAPLVAYGLLCAAGAALVGEFVLSVLFGAEFQSGAPTLTLLCLAVPWYALGFPMGYALIAERRSRAYMAGALLGFVSNLALCLLLIPRFGIEGAGVATLVAFATATLCWLGGQRMVRQLVPTLAILVATTALTAGALAAEVSTVPAGMVTVGAALGVLWRGRTARVAPPA
ncbi:MAG: flippase [Solirubrobacteraceae bacterium]|nr:flippase [Solirubrobacteraceae bacterium]